MPSFSFPISSLIAMSAAAPAVSVTTLVTSQLKLKSSTKGLTYRHCPTPWATAKPRAAVFWYLSNFLRPY